MQISFVQPLFRGILLLEHSIYNDRTKIMRTVKSDSSGLPQVFSIAATTLTRGGTGNKTATFTSTVPHRLTTGNMVRVIGADKPQFNTESNGSVNSAVAVTVTSATVFTYLMNEAPSGNAVVTNVLAQRALESHQYDPFAIIRDGALQVEDRVPTANLYVADTAAHNGTWIEIVALENTVVAALTSSTMTGFAAGMKIPAGAKIKGAFTSITLTSGSILLNS